MKVVLISPFWYREKRGIERFNRALALNLSSKGFEVVVYCWGKKNYSCLSLVENGYTIRKSPDFIYYQSFLASLLFRVWLWRDSPNKIIINFLYQGEQFLPKNYHYVYVLNSPASQIPKRYDYISSSLSRYEKLEFVAVSEMVKREALPYIDQRRISVVYNGVDTSKFVIRKDRVSPTTINLICVAALEKRKGIDQLIKTVTQSKLNISLHIYGAGAMKNELQELIDSSAQTKEISLFDPVDNLNVLLPTYDIFCLFSVGEAFALSPIEALSCGLPVLLNNVSPFDEINFGKYGELIDRKSILEFEESVCRLKTLRTEEQDSIRAKALPYDWKNITESYIKILRT